MDVESTYKFKDILLGFDTSTVDQCADGIRCSKIEVFPMFEPLTSGTEI